MDMNLSARQRLSVLHLMWCALAAVLVVFALVLLLASGRFDWSLQTIRMPALGLTAGLCLAGLAYGLVWPLIRATINQPRRIQNRLLGLALVVGMALRALMFFSEPVLEDDYNRYLWEGAMVAHGFSPYEISPAEAKRAAAGTALSKLALEAGPVLDRVNHPQLRSTYPPMAQVVFALSYFIGPMNLLVWKSIVLLFDIAVMAVLLFLLREVHRPAIWSVLYWWNPIVIKELGNSGHFESLLMLFVLGAIALSAKRLHLAALFVLGLAIATKLWPLVLAPLLLRQQRLGVLTLIAGLGVIAVSVSLAIGPALLAGLSDTTGYLAYARGWTTNSALSPAVVAMVAELLKGSNLEPYVWVGARAILISVLLVLLAMKSWRPVTGADDIILRSSFIVAATVVLSPAQFPWYMIWALSFLPLVPRRWLMLVTVLVPFYYASFHFLAVDRHHIFTGVVVWLIWVPIWLVLAVEHFKPGSLNRRSKSQFPDE